MSDGDRLSERLKTLRDARGWSQARTAQAANITQTALSRLERGVSVRDSVRLVQRLADAFGVSVQELTGATPLPSHVTLMTPDGPVQTRAYINTGDAPLRTPVVMNTPDGPVSTMVMMRAHGAPNPRLAALEEALFRAKVRGDFTVSDFDAARSVLRETYQHMPERLDADDTARAVFEAASGLRRAGLPVNVTSVLARLAYSLLDGTATESRETTDAPSQP